jgi:hypothetical protein
MMNTKDGEGQMAGFPNLFAPERSVRTDSIDEAQ